MKKSVLLATAAAFAVLPIATASAGEPPTKTIVEIASETPELSTLVAALTAAELTGPFDSCDDPKTTVFAPTNDAFAAALAALDLTAEELLGNKDLLTSVLTYHVVAGEVPAATVVGLTEATTLNGAAIKIAVVDGDVILNDTIKVIITDIFACNGVVHVIDGVLVPPAADGGGSDTGSGGGTAPLPETGASSDGLLIGAAALLLGGAGVLLISRRRTVNA